MSDKSEELVKDAIKKAAEEELKRKKAAKDTTEAEEAAEEKADETADTEAAEPANEECADCGEAEDEENAEDGTKKKKSSVFWKKDKKDKKDEQIAELNDKLLRNLAEFDNFRKRTEREKAQMFEIGAKSIVEKIIPVLDSFEYGLAGLSEEEKTGGVGQGMEKIYRQLMTTLEEAGVKVIEAEGKEFDPNFHNAVMHEDNEELGENVVSQELQKGYMYRDSVVRHSMVKVAN